MVVLYYQRVRTIFPSWYRPAVVIKQQLAFFLVSVYTNAPPAAACQASFLFVGASQPFAVLYLKFVPTVAKDGA